MFVEVKYDPSGMKRYQRAVLELTAARLAQISRDSLSNAGNKTATQVRRALKTQMGTKTYGVIVAGTPAFLAGPFSFVIKGNGKGLPITAFPVKGGKTNALRFSRKEHWRLQVKPRQAGGRFSKIKDQGDKGGVTASPWARARTFKRSFVHPSKGFAAHLPGASGGRGAIRKLYGPSIAKEIIKDAALSTFETQGPALLQAEVDRRLTRILP